MSDQFTIVDGIGTARNLVFATWLKSYQTSSIHAKGIPKDLFFAEHHRLIERIFERDPVVRLAVLPDDHDVVLGWVVGTPGIVHYVYVKPSFRRYGIARALLKPFGDKFTYTHATYVLRDLYPRLDGCVYNPYEAHR